MGVTRLLANEWAKHNINVNAIAPGYMATNNTSSCVRTSSVARKSLTESRQGVGAAGRSERACGVPASKASDYINGYTVAVDGGWLAR